MPNLFESSMNKIHSDNLESIKKNILDEKTKQEEAFERERIKRHKESHIFSTYEEAADWMIEHPNRIITWHCDSICYIGEYNGTPNLFKMYTQEYDFTGVMCWDVVKYKTKEQLLEDIKKHFEWFEDKYPEEKGKQWWLDEFGKLEGVYIHEY